MTTPIPSARPVDLAAESVAGEEDPGAALELPSRGVAAPAGAEDNTFCRTCSGDGMLNGGPCPDCDGTGKVGADPAA